MARKWQAGCRLILEPLENRVVPDAGDLDPTFGVGGKVLTDIGRPSSDDGRDVVAYQSDDKLILVGGSDGDMVIVRYNTDGSLDTTFGTGGKVKIDFGSSGDSGWGVAVDSAGRILVGGTTGSTFDFAVARLTASGALDTSFDGDGKQTINFVSFFDMGFSVAVDSADRVLVAGRTRQGTTGYDFAVARLTASGALDTSFDGDGRQTIDFGSASDEGWSVAVDSAGRILVGGYSNQASTGYDFAVARLTASGALDTSFDGDGRQTIDFGSNADLGVSVVVDSTGRVLVAGRSSQGATGYDFAVARLTASGALDTSFDGDGRQTIDFGSSGDSGRSVAVDSAGRILVGGYFDQASTGDDFAVARLTASGALDTSFASDGRQTIDFGSVSDIGWSVAVDSSDRVLVGGYSYQVATGFDIAVARLLSTPPNTAPTANSGGPYTVVEGATLTLSGSGSDPDGGSLTYAWDLDNNGTFETPGQSVTFSTAGLDGPSSRTVSLQVTDNGGLSDTATATVNITNAAPTIAISGDAGVNEGASYTLTLGAVIEPGQDTVTQYVVNWGDGSSDSYSTAGAKSHTYDDGPASRTITVDLVDEDGTHTNRANPLSVAVANVAPAIVISGVAGVNEGAPYTLSLGAVTDPGQDTVTQYVVHWGDGSSDLYSTAGAKTHTYADGPETRAITVDLVDEDGTHVNRANPLSVAVANVAPTVTITGPATGSLYAIGTPVTFTGTFTDPGTPDTHTAEWTFATTITGTVTGSNGSGSVSNAYTFTTPGVYTVRLTVTDDDGGPGTADTVGGLTALVVVYDPSAGFVTGGGWIDSPAGAYAAPGLTGKATFGFVSKYQPGATTPTGQTQFEFKVAALNFHSTSYDWLVVAGARAQFKGTGTVNGAGVYGFLLTAIDGQLNGGGGQDKFRIKIWDKNNNDALVYDNQVGADDTSDPTTVLGGGSIVIHKGQPLAAAGGAAPTGASVAPLTAEELRPLVAEAIRRWQAAGLDAEGLDALRRAEVRVSDLAGLYLGFAFEDEHAVVIDADAAGWGWFVDGTPWEDSEFALAGDQGEQGRMDLLSTVAHELGHLLGLDDLPGAGHADDLMGAALATGTRRLPTAAEVAAATGADVGLPDSTSRPVAPVSTFGPTQPDPTTPIPFGPAAGLGGPLLTPPASILLNDVGATSVAPPGVYWHPDPAAAPVAADPTPPPPRVVSRVLSGTGVEGPPVTVGVDFYDSPRWRESPVERSPALTGDEVGTFWAVDLNDLP